MNFEKYTSSRANVAKKNSLSDENWIENEPESDLTEEDVQNQANRQIKLMPVSIPPKAMSSLNAKMGNYDYDDEE